VPNVPLGVKTPSGVDGALVGLNSCSAFGLAIENDCCERAGMNVADGFVSVSTAVLASVASQLCRGCPFGAPLSGLYVAKPPKTTCQ
jgi:hypothetical protein